MPTSVEMREERAALVQKARVIVDKAAAETREMTAEETQEYDAHMADVDGMRAKIDRIEKLESAEAEQEEPAERRSLPLGAQPRLPPVAAWRSSSAPCSAFPGRCCWPSPCWRWSAGRGPTRKSSACASNTNGAATSTA